MMNEKQVVDEIEAIETLDDRIRELSAETAIQRDVLGAQAKMMTDEEFNRLWQEYGIVWRKLQIALEDYYQATGNGWIPF